MSGAGNNSLCPLSLSPPLSPSLSCQLAAILSLCPQLQESERKKLSKCEHIDIDWGVDGEEEEIYQIPTTASQPQPIKRSDTTGNIAGSEENMSFHRGNYHFVSSNLLRCNLCLQEHN